ncbi:MAG: hypothetical protein VB092_08620 [Oscillospiraceae bacterium]|nr:hypothetical protein [Oscillospiraceae bacterium]
MKEKELAALAVIARALNEADVTWSVGASLLLWRRGLVEDFHDIDLLVDEQDIASARAALDRVGILTNEQRSAPFTTEYFYEYTVRDTEVDVMARFGVAVDGRRFDFAFDARHIACFEDIGGARVPFGRLEDWYILYQLIPGREIKVRLIEDALTRPGALDRAALLCAVGDPLPDPIRLRAQALLTRTAVR